MNAYEYFAIFFVVRFVIPLVALLAIGEWARRRQSRRFGRL